LALNRIRWKDALMIALPFADKPLHCLVANRALQPQDRGRGEREGSIWVCPA
jgi:hypothetical protein